MTGKKIGLVIGNNYPGTKQELNFAVADALSMKEVLLNKDICKFAEVEESINDTFVDARIKIEIILKNANHHDLIFIYFSGHGEKHDNGLRLLFRDASKDYPLATSLNYDYINICTRRYPSLKSVIIVLDCCYSGAAGIRGDDLEETFSNYSSSGPGTVILTSTGLVGSPKAKEDAELKHGIFTKYLLEGLESGGADRDEDGLIYVDDLYEYARIKTAKMCSQSPLMKTQVAGRILIAKNLNKIKEKEYELKKSKLLKEFSNQLPPPILSESLTVLRRNYQDPSSLEQVDITIFNFIEPLLEGEFSVVSYIEALQSLKGISLKTPLIQYGSFSNFSKPEVLLGNTGNRAESVNQEIPKTFTSPSTGMEFVLIPAGKFIMGSLSDEQGRWDDEGPTHEVTIKNSFYIGRYQVIQKQWGQVIGSNPSRFKGEERPVENVSWDDVQEFIKKLNKKDSTGKYRLPSEAEWEYACRAGTTTRYYFGNNESELGDYAWYSENSGSETHPVGLKKPSSWGLYDMHGNVWEWCQDTWHSDYNGAPSDGSAWESGSGSGRVVRGGSWNTDAGYCRSACRDGLDPVYRYYNLGFRLLRNL